MFDERNLSIFDSIQYFVYIDSIHTHKVHSAPCKKRKKKLTRKPKPKENRTMRIGLKRAHTKLYLIVMRSRSHMQVHEFHDSRPWIQNEDRALGKWLKNASFFFFSFFSFGITLKNEKKRKLLKLKRN